MLYVAFLHFRRTVELFEFEDLRTQQVLMLLLKVFALRQLTIDNSSLYETGFFAKGSDRLLNESYKLALKELRPHMVSLAELNYDSMIDGTYRSAIGNEYGDIYEEQLDRAMKSRLNKEPKVEYFDSLIKPMYQWEKL